MSSDWQLCGDNTPIVIGVVLSIAIVLFGSVINFIFWRRKTGTSITLNLRSIRMYYTRPNLIAVCFGLRRFS